jgi:hypothetical protein
MRNRRWIIGAALLSALGIAACEPAAGSYTVNVVCTGDSATNEACLSAAGAYTAKMTDAGDGKWTIVADGPAGHGEGTIVFPPASPAPTTMAPPPTTVPPTTVPPTTDPVPPPATDSAAVKFNWGAPVADRSDEFNGTTIDGTKWGQPGECWPANSTVKGGRCASHNAIGGGTFREIGTPDGKTGYLSSLKDRKYLRVEYRMRVTGTGKFHPNSLEWPKSGAWPSGGELDWPEYNQGDTKVQAFIHHPTQSGVVQDIYSSPTMDPTQYHNYALEWTPTFIAGYLDGVQIFKDTDPAAQPPGPMHRTFQLDNFVGTSGMGNAVLEVDWVHDYALAG